MQTDELYALQERQQYHVVSVNQRTYVVDTVQGVSTPVATQPSQTAIDPLSGISLQYLSVQHNYRIK